MGRFIIMLPSLLNFKSSTSRNVVKCICCRTLCHRVALSPDGAGLCQPMSASEDPTWFFGMKNCFPMVLHLHTNGNVIQMSMVRRWYVGRIYLRFPPAVHTRPADQFSVSNDLWCHFWHWYMYIHSGEMSTAHSQSSL